MEANYLEAEIVQDINQSGDEDYLVKEELGLRLLRKVFASASDRDGGAEAPADPPGERQAAAAAVVATASKDESPPMVSLEGDFLADSFIPHPDVKFSIVQRNWQEFLEGGMSFVKFGSACRCSCRSTKEPREYNIPVHCLGLLGQERIKKVYTEMPVMTWREVLYAFLSLFVLFTVLLHLPESLGGPKFNYGATQCKLEMTTLSFMRMWCRVRRCVLALIYARVALPVVLIVRYVFVYWGQQIVVVITDRRIFAIYYRPHPLGVLCCNRCNLGANLRVECFRYKDTMTGQSIFYGRMNSEVPPCLVRLFYYISYMTGDVITKSKFGVLKLARNYGPVACLYDLVSTHLVEDVEDRKWAMTASNPKEYFFGTTTDTEGRPIVHIASEGTQVSWEAADVDIHSEDADMRERVCRMAYEQTGEGPGMVIEELVYIWSFKEDGLLWDPYNRFNDVVVTTDRVRLRSRAFDKPFDCRTWLCWGACWCGALRKCCCDRPESRCFLNLTYLEAFSTETTVTPAWWLCRCPFYESFCNMLTKFLSCCLCCRKVGECGEECAGCKKEFQTCWGCPGTAPPLTQIWLKWLAYRAKTTEPDMVLSQRPYNLTGYRHHEGFCHRRDDEDPENDALYEDEENRTCAGLYKVHGTQKDREEVVQLRRLMQVVLSYHEEQVRKDADEIWAIRGNVSAKAALARQIT